MLVPRNRTIAALLLMVCVCLLCVRAAAAQIVTGVGAPRRAFEVAAVRESLDEQPGVVRETPGGITYQSTTLAWLISRAFDIPEREVLGGPDWMRTRRFDIEARTEAPANSRDELRLMTQSLLEDRFGLRVERVPEERPVYALVMARADRRLGLNLKPATSTCALPGAFPSPSFELKEGRLIFGDQCGIKYAGSGARAGLEQQIIFVYGSRVTMTAFASALSSMLDRRVVDGTGLTGEFDIEVRPGDVLSAAPTPSGIPISGHLKLFAALEDQLGLKLQSSRAPVDVLKVLAVQVPEEN